MTFNAAIETQRTALLRIVMMLFSQLGIAPGAAVFSMSASVAAFVERVLLPAESAAAWLVIAQARRYGLVEKTESVGLVRGGGSHDCDVGDAERLCARLNALFDLLQDVQKHARRMVAVQKRPKPMPSVSKRIADMVEGSVLRSRVDPLAPRGLMGTARSCVAVPALDSS